MYGLGCLLRWLILDSHSDIEPIPERRVSLERLRSSWGGFHRRAVLTLCDRATDDVPSRRPPARRFASDLLQTVPGAVLAAREPSSEDVVRPRTRLGKVVGFVLVTLIGIGVVTALIIAAWKFGGGGSSPQSIPNLARTRTSGKSTSMKHAKRPARAHLVIRAVRGSSLLSVRIGSATGRPLYQGTLERGQTQSFSGRRLWLNVGSPENLLLRLNKRPVSIGGACPRVLVIAAPHKLSSVALCG